MSKQVFLDEFHIVQKMIRIGFLESEIQKIKAGVTKSSSQEILNDILSKHQKELTELKNSGQQY